MESGMPHHYYLSATDHTVHWGYFSKSLKPIIEVDSGDFVTIETLTHHANDDVERMINGDPGAERVYAWDRDARELIVGAPDPWMPRCSDAVPAKGWACTF
jgi:hypothetical protein